MTHVALAQEVRRVVGEHGGLVDLDTLGDDFDLFGAGMSSHASISLMLALEDAFDIEFPDRMLKRSVFESIDAIAIAVSELRAEAA